MNDITMLSKTGISNYYNNCYMSVIIHSIVGTALAKYIPTPSNISSPVPKAFDECKKKVTCQMVKRFNKRKTGINISKQSKTFSECLMNSSLKLKVHHDAIEFLGKLLKHYDNETIEIGKIFQLECINIQCGSFCENMSGYTSVGQYYLDISVPKSQSSVILESLLYNTFFSNINMVL